MLELIVKTEIKACFLSLRGTVNIVLESADKPQKLSFLEQFHTIITAHYCGYCSSYVSMKSVNNVQK